MRGGRGVAEFAARLTGELDSQFLAVSPAVASTLRAYWPPVRLMSR
jgi:hypothetical protein